MQGCSDAKADAGSTRLHDRHTTPSRLLSSATHGFESYTLEPSTKSRIPGARTVFVVTVVAVTVVAVTVVAVLRGANFPSEPQ